MHNIFCAENIQKHSRDTTAEPNADGEPRLRRAQIMSGRGRCRLRWREAPRSSARYQHHSEQFVQGSKCGMQYYKCVEDDHHRRDDRAARQRHFRVRYKSLQDERGLLDCRATAPCQAHELRYLLILLGLSRIGFRLSLKLSPRLNRQIFIFTVTVSPWQS